MKKLSIIALSFILVLSYSCKKNETSDPDYLPSVAGGWKFISGKPESKYLQIGNDYLYQELDANEIGIRAIKEGVITVTKHQIIFNQNYDYYSYTYAYNYTKKDDTLILTNGQTTMKLLRDDSSPTQNEWVIPITSSYMMDAPIDDGTDITYDGSYLWYGNAYSSDYLYKINPDNGMVDSISVTQSAWAVESDGASLWVSSNGSNNIYEINATNGSLIGSSIDMGAWIYGIAKDGIYLWCYSNNENTLYKYNPNTDVIISSTVINGGSIHGLAMVGGYLFMSSDGYLHKCSTSPLQVESSFQLDGYLIIGIAYDGLSFWASAYNIEEDKYEIIKLSGI